MLKIMANINKKCHSKHHNVGNGLHKNSWKYLNEIMKCDASQKDLWGFMGNVLIFVGVCVSYMYSGANKYLIHCRFFEVSHLYKEWRGL